jgi:hypothetical protein
MSPSLKAADGTAAVSVVVQKGLGVTGRRQNGIQGMMPQRNHTFPRQRPRTLSGGPSAGAAG